MLVGYGLKFAGTSSEPPLPAGRMCVSGGFTIGPPASWIRCDRLIASEIACRTCSLLSALLLFGEIVSKARYGLEPDVGPRLKFWPPCCICAIRPSSAETGGKALNSMPPDDGLLVCSTVWTV